MSSNVSPVGGPFLNQYERYYKDKVNRLKSVSQINFEKQIQILFSTLQKLLCISDYEEYPFKEIEELVEKKLHKTLQKHLINKLTYEIKNREEYDGITIATKDDIKDADDEVVRNTADKVSFKDNCDRIIGYTQYLIDDEFIPESLENDVNKENDFNQKVYDHDYMELCATTSDPDDINYEPPTQRVAISADYYNHSVFTDPNNLGSLVDYCKGDGLGWLVAEYTEDLFDSDDVLLDVISSIDETFDREIGELIIFITSGSYSWERDYDIAIMKYIVGDKFGWLANAYFEGMIRFMSEFKALDDFSHFIQKTIQGQEQINKMIIQSLNDFKTSIDSYNQAYNNYDLLGMQTSWYIFAQQERRKRRSIAKLIDKAKKTFVSIYPAVLKHLYYSDENQQSTNFNIINHKSLFNIENRFAKLTELGRSVKEVILKNNNNTFKTTNIVVAELVFVGKNNGDEDVQFLNVPITFNSPIKLISKDKDDGIIQDELKFKTQIRRDNAAAQNIFNGGDIKVPNIIEGMFKENYFHSERVLLAALRQGHIVAEIVDILIAKINKLSGSPPFIIYGAILLMYSTNSVCNNCTFSIIANQMKSATNSNHITVKKVLMTALKQRVNKYEKKLINAFYIDEEEFKMISMVRSDKAFSVQSRILYGVNKSFGNLKAKIYLDNDSIDVRKLFKYSKCEKMIIECISSKQDVDEKVDTNEKVNTNEKEDVDENENIDDKQDVDGNKDVDDKENIDQVTNSISAMLINTKPADRQAFMSGSKESKARGGSVQALNKEINKLYV